MTTRTSLFIFVCTSLILLTCKVNRQPITPAKVASAKPKGIPTKEEVKSEYETEGGMPEKSAMKDDNASAEKTERDEIPRGGLLEASPVVEGIAEALKENEKEIVHCSLCDDFSEGLAAVYLSGKCGYIDTTGQLVINPKFDHCGYFREGLASFSVDQHIGFIDKTGKVVIEPRFKNIRYYADNLRCFSEGLAAVKDRARWGYIDKGGEFVIRPQYDHAGDFSEGLAAVKVNYKWGYIDKTGNVVIAPQYPSAKAFSEGLAVVEVSRAANEGYIDKTGWFAIEPKYEYPQAFSEGLAAVKVGSNWGYIDKTGKLVIKPRFSHAKPFSNGLAAVGIETKGRKKYGFINSKGKFVIAPRFDNASGFSNERAVVERVGSRFKCVYINKKGRIVIKPAFTRSESFSTTPAFGADKRFKLLPKRPTIEQDLSNVHFIKKSKLSDEAKERLRKNGFVVVTDFRRQLFSSYIDSPLPVFITTDSAIHAYYGLLKNYLDQVESRTMSIKVNLLLRQMYRAAVKQAKAAPSGELKTAAERNVAFLGIAAKILDQKLKLPEFASIAVAEELKLIKEHNKTEQSPIFGYPEDYSVYKPRMRYSDGTSSIVEKEQEQLKNYFMAMTYLKRMGFRIKSKSLTQSAILLADIVSRNPKIRNLFNSTNAFIAWIGGSADDLSIDQYVEILKEVYGNKRTLKEFADEEKLQRFIDTAKKLPDPKINSNLLSPDEFENFAANTKGLRLIPSAFTVEANAFMQLTDPNVATRYMPRVLDIMAVLGIDPAKKIQLKRNKRFPTYSGQLTKLQQELDGMSVQEWLRNHSMATLWSLRSLFPQDKQGLPYFMQSELWDAKSLNTALGGWAAIYHITGIYRKLNYAVGGLYDDFPGYVEPNPEFYNRMVLLIKTTSEKLPLDKEWKEKFRTLIDVMERLRIISRKEIQGQPFTVADQFFIEQYGITIARFFGYNSNQALSPDATCALISDVFTEVVVLRKCLEAGIGLAMQIYVILNVNGDAVLSRGGVFSYYEFEQDMHHRLTDAEWINLWSKNRPAFQDWQKSFISDAR